MEKFIIDNLIYSLPLAIITVFIGIFKTQLGSFFNDLSLYRNRRYDKDGNPATGEICHIFNPATGAWGQAYIEKYTFSVFPSGRKVYVWFESLDSDFKNIWIRSPMLYSNWNNLLSGIKREKEQEFMRE